MNHEPGGGWDECDLERRDGDADQQLDELHLRSDGNRHVDERGDDLGAGHIGNGSLTLVNSGTIDSNGTAGMVIYPNGGTTNTGTIETTAGSTLEVYGTTVTNTGGNLLANTGTLQVEAATVNGGTVTLKGASTLQLDNGIIQGGIFADGATGTIEALGRG